MVIGAWGVVSGCTPARDDAVAPRRPVVNEYHGVKVTDDYQWLEQGTNLAVREWTAKQNARSRAYWDKVPVRERLAEELEDLYEESSANYFGMAYRNNLNFMMRFRPPQQQPVLIWMESITRRGRSRTVVDPNELNTNGTTTIDWYVPSRDGRLVAVSLSEKGSEDGALHFFDTLKTNANKLADVVPRVQYPTAGGSAAWNPDGSGIFYTRFPGPGERPAADEHFYQQVYFHKLGTAVSEDRYEIGKEFPRIAEIELEASEDGKLVLATVANGDGGDYCHWLRLTNGQWRQLTKFEDGVKHAAFGRDALYLLSRRNAPRGKVLRLALDAAGQGIAAAKEFIPQGEAVMESLAPSARGLYVKELVGGPSRVRYFDGDGKQIRNLEFKEPTAVQQMLVRRGEELTYRRVRFTEPYAWNTYDPRSNAPPMRTSLAGTSAVKFDDVEVVRESATSKDGTKVPIIIIKRKSTKLDGNNPTVLYGYGGYGISLAPDFKVSRRLWLDAGGVYAIANLRGGGEFGEAWHKAGSLTNKQNVFDDFIACAEHLIEKRYTNPKKLAIQGGSNGGLLMGAALTQRPDLFRAVAAHVGIYDMLRVELEPNGAFNVTEFGTVTDRAQFTALHAYSPFHRVTNGTAYPAVLLTTGENDGRVNPYNSKKMAARLQAATTVASTQPILLRTSTSAGHGMGSALRDRIEEEADVLSFLIDQLGADIAAWWSKSPVERGPWSGALTPVSATVKAKLRDNGAAARLVVSRDVNFAGATRTAPQKADSGRGRVVGFDLASLEPDTTYHYAVEVNGELEKEKAGKFHTFPKAGAAASFTFAFASCGQTGSTNASYEMIRRHQPLFYFNDGDFHYQNIKVNNVKRFRRAYDRALGSSVQAALYREVPFNYVWDDHDFGGDNANRKASSHEAAGAAYREYVPHYPLPAGDAEVAVYHAFAVGRARFIFTDLRSERDPADQKDDEKKSMMGAKQKEWFKKELLESNGRYPLIFWVSSVPWIGKAGTNYYRVSTNVHGYIHHTNITESMRPPRREAEAEDDDDDGAPAESGTAERPTSRATTNETSRASRQGGRGQRDDWRRRGRRPPRFPFGEDHWSVFSTERREIADFIKSNNIRGLAILHGDAHMLAADNGQYSDYATGGGAAVPVMGAGPLDQNPSIKGGPYSQGVYRTKKGEGCFGLVTVIDDGGTMQVKFSGRNNRDEEKISLEFSVPGGGRNSGEPSSAAVR